MKDEMLIKNQTDLQRNTSRNSMPDDGVRVDGLAQVMELLKHADPQFRNSLLKRLQAKDPKTAQKLLRMFR